MPPTPTIRTNALAAGVRRVLPALYWVWHDAFPIMVPALAAIGFGGVLLRPGSTFASSPVFTGMDRLMSEASWGAMFATVGAVHLLLLAFRPRLHSFAAVAMVGLFLFVSVLFFQSLGLASTGVPVYFLLAIQAAWVASARLD